MDPRLLKYYNRELQFIREMGGEFAQEFPKIAGRLGLEGFECADPYVERLLEGFAFLAARVQLKLDSEFPRFTKHLMEMVYPHYLAPTPSMAVLRLQPEYGEGSLNEGFVMPRGSVLKSIQGKRESTPCEFRTAHSVTLWPLELVEAEYFAGPGSFKSLNLAGRQQARAGARLRLRTATGVSFSELAMDRLVLFLRGADALPMRLYEQFLGNAVALVARPLGKPPAWQETLPKTHIRRLGFEEDQALLPYGPRSFQGYRLLHEYFALPARFMFVELSGLGSAVRRCKDSQLELIVLFDRVDPALENAVEAAQFQLFCTPAINLFPKRADRIHLSNRLSEYHILPDRVRPMDYEVYQVLEVTGFGTTEAREQTFRPFYAADDLSVQSQEAAYYQVRREPRLLSSRQQRLGPRSSYVGSEVFVTLVDTNEAPFRSDLRQLGVSALCTNRDLPLTMPVGKGDADFTWEAGEPLESVRVVAGLTKPKPSPAEGDVTWKLISHLSLNYLSLVDNDPEQGAAALRALLNLYGGMGEAVTRKQIEGLRSVSSQPVIRQLPDPGPITFGRGLEVTVELDEAAFEGTGVFLMGAVLEQFFARYVSLNSFTETVIRTTERGEIMRWPIRIGRRQTL